MEEGQDRLARFADFVSRLLSFVAAAGIFVLMALVFISVFFRYLLNSPILAAEDMMSMLLGITIFTAVPGITLARRHICVELLTAPFRTFPRANRVRLILIDAGVIAMTLFMAKLVFDQAVRFRSRDTGTPLMDWPVHPATFTFSALLLLAAALFAVRAIRDLGRSRTTDGPQL